MDSLQLHAKVLKKTQPPSHHFMYIHIVKSNRAVPCCCQELMQSADIKGWVCNAVEMGTSFRTNEALLPLPPWIGDRKPAARQMTGKWARGQLCPFLKTRALQSEQGNKGGLTQTSIKIHLSELWGLFELRE